MKIKNYLLWTFAILLSGLVACEYLSEEEEQLLPSTLESPIPDLAPAFHTFSIKNTHPDTLRLPIGSQLIVPPLAFVDKEGNAVTGDIQIQYREFHDAIDLFLAGVPTPKEQRTLHTGGGFEVIAHQGNRPLRLAAEKKIEVQLASFQAGQDYSLYHLSSSDQRWDSLGSVSGDFNLKREKLLHLIDQMHPQLQFPLNKNYFVCNYRALLEVYYNEEFTNINHSYLQKRMTAYGVYWRNYGMDAEVYFNGRLEKASRLLWQDLSRKAFPAWTKYESGHLEALKNNQYLWSFQSADGEKQFQTILSPVMSLNTLFAYGPGYWKNNYKDEIKEVDHATFQLQEQPILFRAYAIEQMGIYNWDHPREVESLIAIEAEMNLGQAEGELPSCEVIYCMKSDGSSLMKIPREEWGTLPLLADPNACLFAVLADGKIGYYPPDKYREIEFDELRGMQKPRYSFDMEISEHSIRDADQLKAILRIQP